MATFDFDTLQQQLVPTAGSAVLSHGILVFQLSPTELVPTVQRLRCEFNFDIFLDVTAVDWPGHALRFEVVYHFYSTVHRVRVRVKTRVAETDPCVDTLVPYYGSAAFMERECHDMYGIVFCGNADLRPILLYEGFVGHPLRKDYPKQQEQPIVPYRHRHKTDVVAIISNPVRSILEGGLRDDSVIVNIGPSHPATHGTVQIIAELDGERVLRTDIHCGYLHRGFEKECEDHTWHNLIPYVDRLNYVSALINDFVYCDGVEQLMGVQITPRCRYLRTLLSEYSRLVDHLTCLAAGLMELGAMTAFLYLVMVRDFMYEHLAALTGARVTYTYGRIGGLAHDLPVGWLARLEEILVQYEEFIGRVHGLVDRNRIFIDRMRDVGVINTADALSYGYTGPLLRSTGVPRDLRKDMPYLAYAELDFEVPVGIKGDNYDRYYIRMREMDESVHMMRQLMEMLPEGPINVTDRRCSFPDKSLVYSEIESLINHFKLTIDGPAVPVGEVYSAHEAPNGELGFYMVSTGSGIPHKVHVRSPSFVHMGGVHLMINGDQLADIVPTFGSVNMIGGECDR
ncbi:MAG: NADH-quinone oxidoreductase subunit D [Pseudomonadota bacterium]